MPDLCIAASCNAAVRGVGVPTPRPPYLRGLNALSGLPHGMTSYMWDLALVSDPEYNAGSRYGGVTVEAALILHALKSVLLHWRSEVVLGRGRTATQCGIQCGIRDLARDPWFHGRLNARSMMQGNCPAMRRAHQTDVHWRIDRIFIGSFEFGGHAE